MAVTIPEERSFPTARPSMQELGHPHKQGAWGHRKAALCSRAAQRACVPRLGGHRPAHTGSARASELRSPLLLLPMLGGDLWLPEGSQIAQWF